MKKKSYFEVSSVVNRWLTVGLVLVIVSLMLSQWSSTFTAASDAIAGSFGKALNTLMHTAVGNVVILKGGSDAIHSNEAIVNCIRETLKELSRERCLQFRTEYSKTQ